MKKVRVRNTNQGVLFRLRDSETAPVWIRGEFVKNEGKYLCSRFDDTEQEKLLKPLQEIFIGVTI